MNELHNAGLRSLEGNLPELEQAARWLEPNGLAELGALMAQAALVREKSQGGEVEFCAIVNARSGRCSEDCAFCAQSAHHKTQAEVYSLLDEGEITARGRAAARDGARRFGIVTSGKGCPAGRDLDVICRAAERLRSGGVILPCASLGLLKPEQARRLASAGFKRYHHNLEAGPSYFPRICTTHVYQEREETIRAAQDAGLEVCVGGIVGMGETPLERAELARAVAGFNPQSVPLNFLSPIAGTPLEKTSRLTPSQALAAVAVFRLFNPSAHIRTCGGRHQILGNLAPMMYLAGASATMTGNYLTTDGRTPADDAADVKAMGLKLRRGPDGE